MSNTNTNPERTDTEQTDESGSESRRTSTNTDTPPAQRRHGDDPQEAQTPRHVDGSGGDAPLASEETRIIQRDETGEIIPRREYVAETDEDALAKPLPGSARERYIEETLAQGEDITDAMLAEMFTDYLVVPDLTTWADCPDDHVSEDFIQDGLSQAEEDGYFFAILLASGDTDLVERLRANRRGGMSEDEVRLLDQLGPERMQELMAEVDVEGNGAGPDAGN